MYIKKEAVDDVFAKAKEKLDEAGIEIPKKEMEHFESELNRIASEAKYREGAQIDDSDLFSLVSEVSIILRAAANDEKKGDPIKGFMSITDYLYAMTMQKLGCPNIPASFGSDLRVKMVPYTTSNISRQTLDDDPMYSINAYNNQRGKDAAEVWSNVHDALNAAKGKDATPKQLQQLIVEYQSLQKRQNNHGFFWRAFHSDENRARTELLEDMKTTLEGVFGKDVDFMLGSPNNIAERDIESRVQKRLDTVFKDDCMSQRLGVGAEPFKRMKVSTNVSESTQELRDSLTDVFKIGPSEEVKKIELVDVKQKQPNSSL